MWCVIKKNLHTYSSHIHSILCVSNSNLQHTRKCHTFICMRVCVCALVTPLWRQSRSEVLEVTEAVRSLAEDSLSSSPGKRPSLICKKRKEQHNCRGTQALCALQQSFDILVLLFCFLYIYISPCPASCWAGQQLCDRYLSPDWTLCSRTEPAAPPKKAQQPAGSYRRI